MNDTRQLELLNAAVDDELDEGGRAELEALLASSESARAEFEEIEKLVEFIDRTPTVEPPPELRHRIVAGITLPLPKRKWLGFFDTWTNFGRAVPRTAQFAIAVVTGAALTVGAYTISGSVPGGIPTDQLVGTMTSGTASNSSRTVSEVPVETAVVNGNATLELVDDHWVIGFDLKPERAVVIDVRIDGSDKAPLRLAIAERSRVWAQFDADGAAAQRRVTFEIKEGGATVFRGAFDAQQQEIKK